MYVLRFTYTCIGGKCRHSNTSLSISIDLRIGCMKILHFKFDFLLLSAISEDPKTCHIFVSD
jgi:hypothetical protein